MKEFLLPIEHTQGRLSEDENVTICNYRIGSTSYSITTGLSLI